MQHNTITSAERREGTNQLTAIEARPMSKKKGIIIARSKVIYSDEGLSLNKF